MTLDQVLRWRQVHDLTGLSRTTIWRLVRAGRFPRPINLTPNATGWLASDIATWLEQRRGARDAAQQAAPMGT